MTVSITTIRRAAALAAALVTLSSAAAFAGDIAGRAPVVAAPVTNWSGFYVGGDVGGAFQHSNGTSNFFQTNTAPEVSNNFQNQSLGGSSAIGGVHAGYNWQFAPRWVVGIEGDWQWTALQSSTCRQTDINSVACINGVFGFASISGDTRSIATVRGRLGWTVDSVMIYGTGGVAFADVRTSLSLNCRAGCGSGIEPIATTLTSSTVKTGWVAGAGVEWMVDSNWLVRAEYLRIDLGNLSDTLDLPANIFSPSGLSWSRNLRYDVVRAGISYKFNSLY